MSDVKLRGAIYGCGMISEFHLRGWNRIPEVEIIALCNRTAQRAEERAAQFAAYAKIYTSLPEMLRAEQLDFIDILTPPSLHREHCLAAAEAGLHIICQKPLCPTIKDARTLVAELKFYPKIFAVHENHRYRPWFERVRRRNASGEFGNVSLARIEHINATGPAEMYKNEADTGVLLEYGSHLVDMMRALLGKPLRVYARSHHLNPRVRGESLVHAVFEYHTTTAVIEAGWKHAALTQASVLVAGNLGEAYYEGSLTRGDHGRLRISEGTAIVEDEHLSPYDEYVESFYRFERECTNAMLGFSRTEQTSEEHLKSLECTFAAYESAQQGRIVEIA